MPDTSRSDQDPKALRGSPFSEVPVEITISVGRARPLLRELLEMQDDTVFPLDRRIDDAVELFVGDRLIARGILEEFGGEGSGRLGVRLTEIANLSDSL